MAKKAMTSKAFRAERDGKKAKKKNKYNVSAAADRRCDGRTFDSKKEMHRYEQLKELRTTGHVLWFALQPLFLLPGGVTYKADFCIAWKDGTTIIEDTKGMRTDLYIAKKKIVEAIHGVKIVET